MNRKYRKEGNYIIILHSDGSRAGYWHLQYNGAWVNEGDTVQKGQVIALSCKTGYAAIPHLHLMVWVPGRGRWQHVAIRFETTRGILYLRNWKKYGRPL